MPHSPRPLLVACALIERDGGVLMARRPAHKHLGGKWEFPGGKIESGETAEAALHRELLEELGCTVEILRPLNPRTHTYATVTVRLIPFVVRLADGSEPPQAREHDGLRWVPADELGRLDVPEADLPIIADYLASGNGPSPIR
jgi:8-oxo-dGTP diphosphatase